MPDAFWRERKDAVNYACRTDKKSALQRSDKLKIMEFKMQAFLKNKTINLILRLNLA